MTWQPTDTDHDAFKAFVDESLITTARRAHVKAEQRVTVAAADLKAAQAAHEAAEKASRDAVAGTGGDPHQAEVALEEAQRALNVATKVHQAAEKARDEAYAGIHTAVGRAHEPAYSAGIVLRFKALVAGEAARKALEQAQAIYDKSAWMLNAAAAAGAWRRFPAESHWFGRPIPPLAAELPHWRAYEDSHARAPATPSLDAIIAEATK